MSDPTLRLDAFLPYRLSYTSNRVSDGIASAYSVLFGLSIPEWRVVAVVAERSGIRQHEICTATGMDKVTVSRAAIALAQRGLVSRTRDPADRRAHRLALTTAGETLYGEIAPKALEMERRIFADFSSQEQALLMAMLRRIDAAVERTP